MSDTQEQELQFSEDEDTQPKSKIKLPLIILGIILVIIVSIVAYKYTNKINEQFEPFNITNFQKHQNENTNTTPEVNTDIFNQKIDDLLVTIKSLSTPKNNNNLLLQEIRELKQITKNNNVPKNINTINTTLDNIKNSILTDNRNMLNTYLQKINNFKKTKIEVATPFDLMSINIWNSKPQATLRVANKHTIVDIGDTRLGFKITNIDFDNETIDIYKNGITTTLEIRR